MLFYTTFFLSNQSFYTQSSVKVSKCQFNCLFNPKKMNVKTLNVVKLAFVKLVDIIDAFQMKASMNIQVRNIIVYYQILSERSLPIKCKILPAPPPRARILH